MRLLLLVASGSFLHACAALFAARPHIADQTGLAKGTLYLLHEMLPAVGMLLMLGLAFKWRTKSLALVSVLVLAVGLAIRGVAATRSLDSIGMSLETAGGLGWFGVFVVTIWRHWPRDRLLVVLLTAGVSLGVARLALSIVSRALFPFAGLGLFVVGLAHLLILFTTWNLLDSTGELEPVTSRGHGSQTIIFRLMLLAVLIGGADAILWRLVHLAPPFRLSVPRTMEAWWSQSLTYSLPIVVLWGWSLWRSPDRLAVPLRISIVAILFLLALARFAPPMRELAYLAGIGIGVHTQALMAYVGLPLVAPSLRVPLVVGIGLLHSGAVLLLAGGFALSPLLVDAMTALVAATLLALLLVPFRRDPQGDAPREPVPA